jgi:hypothetical protein
MNRRHLLLILIASLPVTGAIAQSKTETVTLTIEGMT